MIGGARRVRALSALLVGCAALGCVVEGCGGPDDEAERRADALDCEWIGLPTNCYRELVARVDSCLGATDGVGVLSADRLSCRYEDGREVTSIAPLNGDGTRAEPAERDFEVRSASGESCLRFQQARAREGDAVVLETITVTSGAASVRWQNDRGNLQLTCPNGETFTGRLDALFACLAPAAGAPGYAWFNNKTSAWFSLNGTAAPAYHCALPPQQ